MTTDWDITALLRKAERGDEKSLEELYHAVYDQLRAVAIAQRGQWRANDTLNATALVHEAFLKLVGYEPNWNNRRQFFAVAARAMRQILVDGARARCTAKRGGGVAGIPVDDVDCIDPGMSVETAAELLDLEDKLQEMEQRYPRQAKVIECMFFAGMRVIETSEILGISVNTVRRDWSMAMAWLGREWAGEPGH